MKLDIRKQTRLLIWIPLVLSLIIIVCGLIGIEVIEGEPKVNIFSFVCMCVSYVFIGAFTIVCDVKRSNYQWKTKPLFFIQAGALVLSLLAISALNLDLLYTILLVFGIIYFVTLVVYLFLKKKLIITEALRKPFMNIGGELPYEFTSKKVYAFSKISGLVLILVAILGIIFMYSKGFYLNEVLPFALVTILAYIASKYFIIQHEKSIDRKISLDFYMKLNGEETINYIDKVLKEKLHKDKAFEIKLIKVEILEYMGEHELARKIYRSLGKPTPTSQFTYEFVGLDFLEKSDEESYFKALRRIENKIMSIKKEKDRQRVLSLLEDTKLEMNIRFNKKVSDDKLTRLLQGHYQLTRIRNNCLLGKYYISKKDYESASDCLEYVIKYGGEAKKFVHTAEKLLEKINKNGK